MGSFSSTSRDAARTELSDQGMQTHTPKWINLDPIKCHQKLFSNTCRHPRIHMVSFSRNAGTPTQNMCAECIQHRTPPFTVNGKLHSKLMTHHGSPNTCCHISAAATHSMLTSLSDVWWNVTQVDDAWWRCWWCGTQVDDVALRQVMWHLGQWCGTKVDDVALGWWSLGNIH